MPASSVFWMYVREVVRGNLEREAFWLFGMVFRAFHKRFVDPLLLKTFLDSLNSGSIFTGLQLATVKAFCLLQDHYSAHFFSVQ
eukprot:5024548-Prymnesium_polylepis.5